MDDIPKLPERFMPPPPEDDPQSRVADASPAPTEQRTDLTVLLSPSETRGKWKPFTRYIGSDPESDVPGVRVDGYVSPDGIEYVVGPEQNATHKVVFERFPFLGPIYLVPLDASQRVSTAVKRVKRQRRNLQKRGLE